MAAVWRAVHGSGADVAMPGDASRIFKRTTQIEAPLQRTTLR